MTKRINLLIILSIIIFSRNAKAVTQFTNAMISENTTWSGEIIVLGTVTVGKNASLTILPGTVIRFIPPDGNLNVKGTLLAGGTYEQRITFTLYDENNPLEKWEGVIFSEGVEKDTTSSLSNCLIKFANTGIKCSEKTILSIENCSFIKNNLGINILLSSDVTVSHSEFIENINGAVACEQSNVKILNSYFNNNNDFAITCTKKSEGVIEENLIIKHRYGIIFAFVETKGIIKNNIIQENEFGIFVERLPELMVSNNTLRNNDYGIYLERGPKPGITMNEITENRIGIFIRQNSGLNVNDNNIYNNREYEIGLKEVSSDIIRKMKQIVKDKKDTKDVFPCMKDGLDIPDDVLTDYIDAQRNFWGEEMTKEMELKGDKANITKILDFYDNSEALGKDGNMYKEKYIFYGEWKKTAIEGAGAGKKPSYGLIITK
ncbi:MAG: right-handed parallel beta-helix repeat-containing protein [bacterium]